MAESDSEQRHANWAAALEGELREWKESLPSDTAESPALWLMGVLERGLAASRAEVAGYATPSVGPIVGYDSFWWCQSRIVCPTDPKADGCSSNKFCTTNWC